MMYGIFLSLLFLSFAAVAGVQVRWVYRRRRLMAESWDTVLGRAERIDLDGVRTVAECYLQPDRNQLRVETDVMWDLLGGLEGLGRLQKNAGAILDLAVYAQRWNDTEGAVVAAMIRRDAVRLQRAVTKAQIAALLGFGFVKAPLHIQEAAATYYLMRSRLIGLYENSHVALLPRLEAAV